MAVTVRVVDLETTGSQPWAHGVCEIGWQDVVQDDAGQWRVDAGPNAVLTDPGRAIPPVTAAIHHIVDDDVAGAPPFRAAAVAVLGAPVAAFAAHRAAFEQRWCTPDLTGATPWVCTWKCALRVWPEAPSFSNQVLRYWRMPAGLDRGRGLPVHRAGPDAYVTAHHLRDMLGIVPLDQLVAWSAAPALLPRLPAGPHRGRRWSEIDEATLAAAAHDRDEDVRHTAAHEIARRRGLPPPEAPPVQGQLF